MNPVLEQLARGLGDVLFPPVCVYCRGLVPSEGEFRHLCPRCAAQLDFVRPPHCATCGHPFYGELAGERICPHCAELAPAFREGRTAVLLKGPARALVHELKYHRGLHVLADIEAIFRRSAHVLELVRDALLVPVPLHPRKERERGFNQSALLAECLGELLPERAVLLGQVAVALGGCLQPAQQGGVGGSLPGGDARCRRAARGCAESIDLGPDVGLGVEPGSGYACGGGDGLEGDRGVAGVEFT